MAALHIINLEQPSSARGISLLKQAQQHCRREDSVVLINGNIATLEQLNLDDLIGQIYIHAPNKTRSEHPNNIDITGFVELCAQHSQITSWY